MTKVSTSFGSASFLHKEECRNRGKNNQKTPTFHLFSRRVKLLISKHSVFQSEQQKGAQRFAPDPSAPDLIRFFSSFLAIPLARQRFLYAALFPGLQVEAVTLHFLDDVLGLHLALKAPECILKRLAFLHANLCQSNTPRSLPRRLRSSHA